MRHPWLPLIFLFACDGGETAVQRDLGRPVDVGVVDTAPPDLDAGEDAFRFVPLDMDLRDAGPRDAEVDFEPFEAGPSPYSMDAARDPSTLGLTVLQDWQPVLNGTARQKRVEIVLDVLPSGRVLRVPVLYAAPAEGCPCNFFVIDGGYTREVRAIDSMTETLLAARVGMVAVGIAPLADLGTEGEAAAEELLALLNQTGDVRRTELWLWGHAYMRAATAALTEQDVFSPSRIGAAGRSRGGIAATTAVIQDSRFVALSAWLTPLSQLPPDLLPVPRDLSGTDRRRLRFQAERMSMPIFHVPELDERRVDLYFHNASNDLQTPGLLEAGRLDRELPMCIEPNAGHGRIFRPLGEPVPIAQPFEDTRLSLLEFSLAQGSRLPTPPIIGATVVGETMTLTVRFRNTPRPNDGMVWFTFDRAADDDRAYEDSVWQSLPMTRLDNSTFVTTMPVPPGVSTVDAFSYHTLVSQGRSQHVSSAYARFTVGPAR